MSVKHIILSLRNFKINLGILKRHVIIMEYKEKLDELFGDVGKVEDSELYSLKINLINTK